MNATVLIFVGLILAALAFFIFLRKRKEDRMDDPTYGDVPHPGGPSRAEDMKIGPKLKVYGNKSVGVPETMLPHPDGFYFDFPYPDVEAGHVHYVMYNNGPMTEDQKIIVEGRIEANPDVKFFAKNPPTDPGLLTVAFQRRNDNFTGAGKYEAYRWYATSKTIPLVAGDFKFEVSFDDLWTAVEVSSNKPNPAQPNLVVNPVAFKEAIRDAGGVGFVIGGGDGYGHGAYASGPAKFILTKMRVV